MSFLKIVAVTLMATISATECSVVAPALTPVPALPAIRYAHFAPPSVLPFSAQVSTFTRNLHVFDAPYAAGVLPGHPAIVQRALLPAPAAPLAPAPFIPAPAPFIPTPVAPAPIIPAPAVAGVAPGFAGLAPAFSAPGVPHPALSYAGWPVAGGFGRSVHAVAPAPLLG